jgi:phosphohistidine swiveling domain-containing protein
MNYISEASHSGRVESVGGKGMHLQKLIKWGAPVAPFFVLTTECFEFHLKHKKFPLEVSQRFEEFFKSHPRIALRSSMIAEDHADASFAGMFETLLDVHHHNWVECLSLIYESVNSPRVREYLEKKNLVVNLLMAVVAQELIAVEKSGVLFTRSPVSPTSAVAIDAAFGMGEGVVSGLADVDHYQLTRTLDVIQYRSNNLRPVLSEIEIKELVTLSLKLEHMAGSPSDIEWGFKESKLYIFQIRPITRSFDPLTYFVDTNLAESYPGTVSPFTAGFVQKAYENVFRESAIIMGAENNRLENLTYHYAKLICSADDHLYYNLEHYYAALRALPGGEKNIENWHRMIGGKMEGIQIPHHATQLSKTETIFTILKLLELAVFRKNNFLPFLNNLESLKVEITTEIAKRHTPVTSIQYLHLLINRRLGFGLTVVNDIFIMMGLGFLTKTLKKKGIEEDKVIDLLKTAEGVDSIKPLTHFNLMVKDLSQAFITAFESCDLQMGFAPYEAIFHKLHGMGFERENQIMQSFLNEYGDRSFEELKLESLPIKNNPLLMKQLLSWAKANPSVDIKPVVPTELPKLGWFELIVLNFTRESIATREAARLWRGKFYHLLRHLILNLSEQLKREDHFWDQFSIPDFFSINHHEWKCFADGELSKLDLEKLIIIRRTWQSKKQHYPEIIPWAASETLPVLNTVVSSGLMEGQGVSPGIAEGIALVLDNPNEALLSDFKNFILVTKNTDPAWVYIMSRSQGLISEKGSLLSHTAIIGRELNIPTIVGVKMATLKIKNGSRIRIDASRGTIEIL